jgi:N6-L-threonylcarbamoyladenine synthase
LGAALSVLCLGIETSCDESALALVRDGKLIAETIKTQVDLHALFGGVVPEIASREHGRAMGALYELLFEKSGLEPGRIDVIAVARGPGLLGSLLVGIAFAKGLAFSLERPIIGVNHLHAHLLAAGLEHEIIFPALGLLVSGGHTHIYKIYSPTEFVLLGRSLDDAAGEAIDKFGKFIGLPYPAGKFVDQFGSAGRAQASLFPKPYLDNANLDFSFSGLKTAAVHVVQASGHPLFETDPLSKAPLLPKGETGAKLCSLCASFAHTVAETLAVKFERAIVADGGKKAASLVLAGGVAANSSVRKAIFELASKYELPLLVPGLAFCTDNAAMIAYAGWLLAKSGLCSRLDFSAIPRGQLVPDDYYKVLS